MMYDDHMDNFSDSILNVFDSPLNQMLGKPKYKSLNKRKNDYERVSIDSMADLEKDLEQDRKYLNNLNNDFEKDLRQYDPTSFRDAFNELNFSDMTDYQFTTDDYPPPIRKDSVLFFTIYRCCDIITDITLIIEPNNTIEQKHVLSLLKSDVLYSYGSDTSHLDTLFCKNLLTCCFVDLCKDNENFNLFDNELIHIPIVSFDIKNPNNSNYSNGLLLFKMMYVHNRVELYLDDLVIDYKYKLLIKGKMLSRPLPKWYNSECLMNVIMQSHQYSFSINNNEYYDLKSRGSCSAKCLLFYYMPHHDINNDDIDNDYLTNYPIVTGAKLVFNDKILIEYDIEDIIKTEIYGITIHCLSFSNDCDNLEKLHNMLTKEISEFSNISFNRMESIKLYLYTEEKVSSFSLYVDIITLNMFLYSSGLGSLRYTS